MPPYKFLHALELVRRFSDFVQYYNSEGKTLVHTSYDNTKIVGTRSYEYPGDPAKRQVCARWPRCTETRNLPVIVATLKNADIDDVPIDDENNMDT